MHDAVHHTKLCLTTERYFHTLHVTLSTRQAATADRDFLYELHVATMRDYVDRTWGWDEQAQRRMFDQHFEPSRIEVIELDGRAIGMQVIGLDDASIELGNIEIAPEHQGHGYGTTLIRRVLERGSATGRRVRLQVLKVNPARQLYERIGFELAGETATHYLMEWSPTVS